MTHASRKRRRPRWVITVKRPPLTPAQKLSRSANDALRELAALVVEGSADAASELHRTIAAGVQTLNRLCRHPKRELFVPIASEKLFWPVMGSLHPEQVNKSNDFLRGIQLGRKTQINISSGKRFSWEVPPNGVAVNLLRLARDVQRVGVDLLNHAPSSIFVCGVGVRCHESNPKARFHANDDKYSKQLQQLEAWGQTGEGSGLPELSKKTATQWAKAGDELFQIAYGRDTFETHPYLRSLRQSVVRRAKDSYGRTTRGAIRKAMRQAVKQAWRSIAAVD